MSLLNQASTWDTNELKKKRKSTIKTSNVEPFADVSDTIKEVQQDNMDRTEKIHKLIDNMKDADNNQEEDMIENYANMPNPMLQHKSDQDLQTKKIIDPSYNINTNKFHANQKSSENLSNYQTIYEPAKLNFKFDEGFSNMNQKPDDNLLKKINYMINLLEEQQHEKTNNITEEFILYSFLGIFVIYIVDSFSRSGKYRR
tara:strand:- start:1164 stop:1763 length:600 start_codon:yes stop_codon:yes gene_type:complete